MPTKKGVLASQLASFVERWVASGRHQNVSEVPREGLRLVARRELEEEARLVALREAAQSGIADMAAGRYEGFESSAALGLHLASLADEAIEQG